MNKEEIKDLLAKLKRGELCTPNCYGCCGDNELDFAYCQDVADNFEKELANLSYREVTDDEMVVKKSEYEKLSKDYATINNEAYYCGLSVGKEEAAIEVADKIYNKLTESDVWHDMKKIWWRHNNECYELKGVLKQVLKELGIELEE